MNFKKTLVYIGCHLEAYLIAFFISILLIIVFSFIVVSLYGAFDIKTANIFIGGYVIFFFIGCLLKKWSDWGKKIKEETRREQRVQRIQRIQEHRTREEAMTEQIELNRGKEVKEHETKPEIKNINNVIEELEV